MELPKVLYAFLVKTSIWGIPSGSACLVYELPPMPVVRWELECYDTRSGQYTGNYLFDFNPKGQST